MTNLLLTYVLLSALSVGTLLFLWSSTTLPGLVSSLLMPKSWLGRDRGTVTGFDLDDCTNMWALSKMPSLLLTLITCYGCLSVHLSFWSLAILAGSYTLLTGACGATSAAVAVWSIIPGAGLGLVLFFVTRILMSKSQ